jgi:hypothetical protein
MISDQEDPSLSISQHHQNPENYQKAHIRSIHRHDGVDENMITGFSTPSKSYDRRTRKKLDSNMISRK